MRALTISCFFFIWSLAVVQSLPVDYQNSPIFYLEVKEPHNVRVARMAGDHSLYPYGDPSKTPAGVSNVKTEFNRKIRGARLHVADGAYPVYYTPGTANGRFGARIYTLNGK